MRSLVLLIVGLPVLLLANEHVSEVDIVPRTVNFIIFIAILYYLLNDKIRDFFSNRKNEIQARLKMVDEKLSESNKKVEDAKAELKKSKQIASDLVENTKNELEHIKQKVLDKYEEEIKIIEKNFEERIELETKRMKKEVVEEVLDEILKDGLNLNQKDLTNIVLKKVA